MKENIIYQYRSLLNMSQREFAIYLQIPLRTIQSWEQGFRNPPVHVVSLIQRILLLEKPELFD